MTFRFISGEEIRREIYQCDINGSVLGDTCVMLLVLIILCVYIAGAVRFCGIINVVKFTRAIPAVTLVVRW